MSSSDDDGSDHATYHDDEYYAQDRRVRLLKASISDLLKYQLPNDILIPVIDFVHGPSHKTVGDFMRRVNVCENTYDSDYDVVDSDYDSDDVDSDGYYDDDHYINLLKAKLAKDPFMIRYPVYASDVICDIVVHCL